MLALASSPRIGPKCRPGGQRRRGRLITQASPAIRSAVVAETKIRFAGPRRRRDPAAALGHGSAGRRSRHPLALAKKRSPEFRRQLGVSIDRGRRLPLSEELRERCHHAELGRGEVVRKNSTMNSCRWAAGRKDSHGMASALAWRRSRTAASLRAVPSTRARNRMLAATASLLDSRESRRSSALRLWSTTSACPRRSTTAFGSRRNSVSVASEVGLWTSCYV